MTRRRRPAREEPMRCVCEPGNVAHTEHSKPGKRTAAHLNPECPHSTLADTTRRVRAPAKRKKPKRLRLI